MPTNRKRRTRKCRTIPGTAIERYVRCEITADELNEAVDSPFAEFVITNNSTHLGKQAYTVWLSEGKELLARYNYTGPKKVPGYNIVDYGDLPENLIRMVSAYGVP